MSSAIHMFKPLNDEKEADMTAETVDDFAPIVPPPVKPTNADVRHHIFGTPAATFRYYGPSGFEGFVRRFNSADSDGHADKTFLPLRYGTFLGRTGWHCKGWTERRPLYRLRELLASKTTVPVIVTEGESKADRAAELFSDHAAVAPMNGAQSPGKTDWTPLRGRRVVIWPDNDKAGSNFAAAVARLAHAGDALSVSVVKVPDAFLPKWDLADLGNPNKPLPDGWTEDNLRSLLAEAKPVEPPPGNAEQAVKDGTRVNLVCADDITAEPIRWLWNGYIARGKFHVLAGAAGTGKTTLAMAMAGAVTTGGRWPDGTKASVGAVMMWSGEDGLADSLKPRLMANGGDPRRVFFVNSVSEGAERRSFDPATDMQKLAEAARQIPDLRLVVIDPVVSAVSGDSHKNAEVRRGLQPLVDLATGLDCAVLGITHFTKSSQGRDPTERVTGSLAFGALARVVMCTAKPTEEGAKRRLVRSKSNIGPDGGGFEYGLDQVCVDDGPPPVFGQCVTWGDAIEGTARELLHEVEGHNDDDIGSALDSAVTFLRDLLADGPVLAKTVRADASDAGHTWATIRRAKAVLCVVASKEGMPGGWVWKLPSNEPSPRRCSTGPEDAQQNCVSTFAENEHLREPGGWEVEL